MKLVTKSKAQQYVKKIFKGYDINDEIVVYSSVILVVMLVNNNNKYDNFNYIFRVQNA